MLKIKILTQINISKLIYCSLAILLLCLFINTPTKTIESASLKDFYSGVIQALFLILVFLSIKKMTQLKGTKKVAIFIISFILLVNIILAVFSVLPSPNLIIDTSTQTNTNVDIDARIECAPLNNRTEIDATIVEPDNLNCKNMRTKTTSKKFNDTNRSVFVKYTWLLNFLIVALIAYAAIYIILKKAPSATVYEEFIAELVETQEIQIDEITLESYEQGVFILYRQLCEVAKTRNGLTRRKSMTSTEYGALLVKLGFPEFDVFEIINAFEALRYGKIQASIEHIGRLNQALTNINIVIKLKNKGENND